MSHGTNRSIGKVIPLRQHKRNPALGSALGRLVGEAAGSPAGAEPFGDAAVRSWLSALDTLEARRARALEADANRLRVADGALAETLSHLRRMRELASEAARGQAQAVSDKLATLAQEIDRIADNADWDGRPLLAGSERTLADATAEALGVAGLDAADPGALERIEQAVARVTRTRSALAGFEQQIETANRACSVVRENVAAACVRPADVDAALDQAIELQGWVVSHAERAARSQAVAPAVVLKLVR